MIYHIDDKVMIRLTGEVLQFGDIAIIKEINHTRVCPYYCFDPLRNDGEWMPENFFDKYKERPPIQKKIIPERVKFYGAEKIVRPPATYTNIKHKYHYDDDDLPE